MQNLWETLGGVDVSINPQANPTEEVVEEVVIVQPGEEIIVTEVVTPEEKPYGFQPADEWNPNPEQPENVEGAEALKAQIEKEAQERAAAENIEIKNDNQEGIDDELELIKKHPETIKDLIYQYRADITKYQIMENTWRTEKTVYKEKLDELYKEKALSKWDDDMIVVSDESRPMWLAIHKSKQNPTNVALENRAIERIAEFMSDLKPSIDVKKVLAVAFENNIEKPNTLESENQINVQKPKTQFNDLGMSTVQLNAPNSRR